VLSQFSNLFCSLLPFKIFLIKYQTSETISFFEEKENRRKSFSVMKVNTKTNLSLADTVFAVTLSHTQTQRVCIKADDDDDRWVDPKRKKVPSPTTI